MAVAVQRQGRPVSPKEALYQRFSRTPARELPSNTRDLSDYGGTTRHAARVLDNPKAVNQHAAAAKGIERVAR
jgi:hypothetical protein